MSEVWIYVPLFVFLALLALLIYYWDKLSTKTKERIRAMPHSGRIQPPGRMRRLLYNWAGGDLPNCDVPIKLKGSMNVQVKRKGSNTWEDIGDFPIGE